MGGDLNVRWIHGSSSAKHNQDPEIQVHAYDQDTFILRQNKAVHYEAPFLFLLFGQQRAVLIDTGATESADHFPLRRTVDDLVAHVPVTGAEPAETAVLKGDARMADVLRLSDRISIVKDGRLIGPLTPSETRNVPG